MFVLVAAVSHLALHTGPGPKHHRRHRFADAVPAMRYDAPRSVPALAGDLSSQLSRRVRGGRWGAIVVSLTRGDTLFEENPDMALQPASTMKLFTSALVLDRLGPDYCFSTDVLRDGPVDATGTVQGNLIIRGDGDPVLRPQPGNNTCGAWDVASPGLSHSPSCTATPVTRTAAPRPSGCRPSTPRRRA